jgi:two-component system osmolarity sensor histidine kinase EnvZ
MKPRAPKKKRTPALPSPPPPPAGGWRLLWWRFNRFLERHLPTDLYRRALLIVVLPILLLFLVTTGIVLDRHWEEVTKRLSKSFGRDIGLIVRLYDHGPKTPEAVKELQRMVNETLEIGFAVESGPLPPLKPRPWFSILHYRLSKYVARFAPGRPFWIDTSAPDKVDVRVLVDRNLVFRFHTWKSRVYASSTSFLLLWMAVASIVLVGIAVLFLRKQIAPILDLAGAMQAFGKGRRPQPLQPRGASEVRAATEAFLLMKQRIERHVEQRTAMLAGISHDLRTIITRFRLELSMLDADPDHIAALKRDVDEMQHMLEGYMDFVRGAEGEPARETDICSLLRELREKTKTGEKTLELRCPETPVRLSVRPGALKRALANVIENALRHAHARVRIAIETEDNRLRLLVDDDGPGIPEDERERVFRPFVRLDDGRNLDAAGTGLGLAIARDLIHGHGGRITLADSPLGGLRVEIVLPR